MLVLRAMETDNSCTIEWSNQVQPIASLGQSGLERWTGNSEWKKLDVMGDTLWGKTRNPIYRQCGVPVSEDILVALFKDGACMSSSSRRSLSLSSVLQLCVQSAPWLCLSVVAQALRGRTSLQMCHQAPSAAACPHLQHLQVHKVRTLLLFFSVCALKSILWVK